MYLCMCVCMFFFRFSLDTCNNNTNQLATDVHTKWCTQTLTENSQLGNSEKKEEKNGNDDNNRTT